MTPKARPLPYDIIQQLAPSVEQRPAIEARGRDMAVVAGAGSGKTRTLVARYLNLLQEGLDIRGIVAITFTDKAAREMRSRVRHEVAAFLASGLDPTTRALWQGHYARLDSARISTIHSLCGEILRAHPVEADLDPLFDVLPESEQGGLLVQTIEDAISWATSQKELLPLLQAYRIGTLRDLMERALRKRLDVSALYERMSSDPWPVWSAVALEWFQQRLLQPEAIEAMATLQGIETAGHIDSAERAGDKLAGPLRELLIAWADVRGAQQRGDWASLTSLLPIMRGAIELRKGAAKNWPTPSPKATLKDLAHWYDTAFAALPKPGRNPIDPTIDRLMAQLAPAFRQLYEHALAHYTEAKDRRNALDFDDLEARALALLVNPKHDAVSRRWQRNVNALLVDEFQDTNGRQRDLVTLLSGLASASSLGAPAMGKLFVVGDGKQSIYRFRGADVSVFRDERTAIAARGGVCYELATSYRAHPVLLQGINRIMSGILRADEDPERPYAEPFASLRPYRTHGAQGLPGAAIECHLAVGPKNANALDVAANALAERFVQLVEGDEIILEENTGDRKLNYGDIAILCRSSGAFGAYEDALDHAGIPYVTVAGKGFYDRPEIRDLLGILQALSDPGDDLALAGALRSPAFGVSDMALYALTVLQRHTENKVTPLLWDVLAKVASGNAAFSVRVADEDPVRCARAHRILSELQELVGRAPVSRILKRLLDNTHYRSILIESNQPRAVRNIDKLLVDAYASQHVGVGAFLEYVRGLRDVAAREGEARAPGEGVVQIMSIHAAKGLEFPVVVLGDAASGAGQHATPMVLDAELGPVLQLKTEEAHSLIHVLATRREKDQEEEESRRLLYVALTRARELLIISGNLDKPGKAGTLGAQRGWLKWLSAEGILGLVGREAPWDADGCIEETEPVCHDVTLDDGTLVGLSLYPLGYRSTAVSSIGVARTRDSAMNSVPILVEPIPRDGKQEGDDDASEKRSSADRRVWRVIDQEGRYPAWLLGHLVHESLALWSFPSDTRYERWAGTIARDQGLVDDAAQERLINRARRLLRRFQRHPLYRQIDNARRLHEVPFEIMRGTQPVHGRIDLLTIDGEGWCVYEFKSDHVPDDTPISEFLAGTPYCQQARFYAHAVEQLVGSRPQARLVLLDLHGHVHIQDVALDEP